MEDHIEHAPYPLLHEAVFELKEAGLKLDVTRWVPRLTQSVKDREIDLPNQNNLLCIINQKLILNKLLATHTRNLDILISRISSLTGFSYG